MAPKASKRVRILLVQIVNHNLGDAVIADNTEYILKKAMRKAGLRRGCILRHDIASQDYSVLPYVQAIVFAGGGLIKFQQEHFYQNVIDLVNEANRLQIPVFFNSVGVEGYDPQDERCFALKKAIALPYVKAITCRDDIDTLRNCYLRGCYKTVSPVMDPAIFCKSTYRKQLTREKRTIIGLGITRHKLFAGYGIEGIDHDYLLHYWYGITQLLEQQGYEWELFTNGLDSDEAFAEEVLQYIGHGAKAPQPVEGHQLVEQINRYRGIIAGRMHSNIIAYSLGVPSIGFVWNQKLRFWGEHIGTPERFLTPEQMTPKHTVQALHLALQQGCQPVPKEEKQKLVQELSQFLKSYALPDPSRTAPTTSYSNRLIATALGGSCLQYENMNTPLTVHNSLEQGFTTLEVDLRLTSDHKLVCVNGWNRGTYKRLGLAVPEDGSTPALTEEAFLSCTWYHYYPTCTFETLLQTVKKEINRQSIREVKLLLDIGLPSKTDMQYLLEQLKELTAGPVPEELFISYAIRLQRQKDVEAYLKSGLTFPVIYYLPTPLDESEEEQGKLETAIQYCKQKNIRLISMNSELWNEVTAQLVRANGLEAVVFSYSAATDLIHALDLGARFVGSRHFTPDYIEKLTN